MQNLKKFGKKLFTMSVVSMTVAWSVGLSAFVPAGAALAAPLCPELSAGDLFKVTGNSAVYLVNSLNKRMYFPNAEVYNTWYKDFSGITTIDTSCVEAFPSGGGVNFRPGSRLVKTPVSPSVYAVGPNNTKMKIADEATASALYGSNWSTLVRTLNDVFDSNYNVGTPLSGATLHNGQLVKKSGESTVYYVWDGALKMVDGTLPTNVAGDVRTVSAAVFSSVAMSTGSVTASTVVNNPAQQSGSTTTPTTPVGGSLSVGLSAETAAAGTLASGTVYNNMLKLTLNATSGDVKVKGVTVTRTGLITNAKINGVSVWDSAGNRHGDVMSSFSSENKVTIGFGTNPIVVTKGVPTTLTVAFNFASDAQSGTVGATLASAADLQTDGTVAGTFPIVGNTMSMVDGTSTLADAVVTAVSPGGISANDTTITSATGNVEIGETKEVAKFKFDQSNGLSDVAVSKLTFYVQGSAKDKDVTNFEVVAPDNTVLGHTEFMSDRYVTVNFDKPYVVPKSTNRTLTLRATIADGSGNWFQVQLQNDYDLMVKDTSTGYYVLPEDSDAGTWTAAESADGYFKMKSGNLTVSKTGDSPSTTVSAGTNDVVLARFNVKAVGEDLEIRKIGLKIATGTSAVGAKALTGSVKLRVGTDILYTASASDTTYTLYNSDSTDYNLSQYLTLKSGETKVLEVLGSIPTTATSVSSFRVYVGNMFAKRLSTLDYSEDLPGTTANIAGNTVTVESASVTLAKDTAMGNMTRAAGSAQVIGQYTIKAGSAENIKLSNVTVKFNSYGAWNTPSDLQNLELWVGDTQYGSTVSSVATTSNVFLGSLVINKNEIKTIKVKAYIVSGASGTVSSTIDAYNYVGADTQNTTSETTDVTGQDSTMGSANVIISAANDTTTASSILVPSGTATAQIGKWKVEAQNEAVTLKKITFTVFSTSSGSVGFIDTTSGNFGTFYLYDESSMATPVGTASYIGGSGNGYVQFTGVNLTVPANTYKYLVVKANVTGSGVMTPGSISTLVITNDASTNLEIVSSSGTTLSQASIDAVTSNADTGTEALFATSTWHLFHNAAPVIVAEKVSADSTFSQNPASALFKFTITNNGDRELKITSTTVRLSASGLTGNGTATGSVSTFRLYEDGNLLAENTTCALAGGAILTGYTCVNNAAVGTAAWVDFNSTNDLNSAFDGITIKAGGSRTFTFTADTSNVFNGKTQGSVSLTPSLEGDKGFSSNTGWAAGVVKYYYTDVNSSEQGPYTASDSYDTDKILGQSLTAST